MYCMQAAERTVMTCTQVTNDLGYPGPANKLAVVTCFQSYFLYQVKISGCYSIYVAMISPLPCSSAHNAF